MRDTDDDWQRIAVRTPYFGVLADKRFLNPTAEDLSDFFRSGEADVEHVLSTVQRQFGTFRPHSALDFGCGVGRTLIPIARRVSQALGVDVAEGMRTLAKKHLAEARVNAVVLESIPEDKTFDWVHSSIVFQHIPPSRGYFILKKLWSQLNPNGFLTVQITIFRNGSHVGEVLRDLSSFSYDGERILKYLESSGQPGEMSMYDYDLSRVLSVLDLQTGHEVFLECTVHGGCHGVRIYVQRR